MAQWFGPTFPLSCRPDVTESLERAGEDTLRRAAHGAVGWKSRVLFAGGLSTGQPPECPQDKADGFPRARRASGPVTRETARSGWKLGFLGASSHTQGQPSSPSPSGHSDQPRRRVGRHHAGVRALPGGDHREPRSRLATTCAGSSPK